VAGLADSDEEPFREPPEELAEWKADDGEEDFSWELPGELLLAAPLVEVVGRDPDEAERFFEEPEEDVPEDRVPEEEAVLFFFAEELPEEDFFAEELVEEPAEL
jgi:hypothetical protein